jgi:quinol monooxygenase YgiN
MLVAPFLKQESDMSEVVVVALVVAKPGAEARLQAQLEGIVGPTRQEPGALQYDLHRDLGDPRRFVFVERWESEAALTAHQTSAHIQAYKQAAEDWIERADIHVTTKLA